MGALFLVSSACTSPVDPIVEAAEAAAQDDRGAYLSQFTTRSRELLELMWNGGEPQLTGPKGGAISIVESTRITRSLDGRERVRVVFEEGKRHYALIVHSEGGRWCIDLVDSEGALTGLGGGI